MYSPSYSSRTKCFSRTHICIKLAGLTWATVALGCVFTTGQRDCLIAVEPGSGEPAGHVVDTTTFQLERQSKVTVYIK